MENEEQILGMMAAAQKQQEAAEQAIEGLNLSRKELHASLASQQNKLAEDHREAINHYKKEFSNHNDSLSKVLHWLPIAGSVALTAIICAAMFGLTFLYLDSVVDDVMVARAARDKLKAYNVDIRTCERDGEKFPCAPIVKDASYGDGTIFILKQK